MSKQIQLNELLFTLVPRDASDACSVATHLLGECSGYRFVTFRQSETFAILCDLMTYDDFDLRWDYFIDCIRKGLFTDVPVYTSANWLNTFIPKMCPSENGYSMHGTNFRFLKAQGEIVINELSLMIVLVGLYLITGINWMSKLSLFVDIDICSIDNYGGDIEDTYLRTFIYCMHFLALKRRIMKLDTSIQFETLFANKLKKNSLRGLSFVYPKNNGYSSSLPNFFTNICLLLNYNEPRVELFPYVRSSHCIETFYFGMFMNVQVIELVDSSVHCDHSVSRAIDSVKKETAIEHIHFENNEFDSVCTGQFVDDILDNKDIDTGVSMRNIQIDKEILIDLEGKYNDSEDMKVWIKSIHNGSKKNLASFLFFIDKYKELILANPSAKVYFIGCGDSPWYQVIPTFLYDRHIVFIDKEIRRERMRGFPNITLRYDYVYDVYDEFKDSICIMDMSRMTDDRDLLSLMIRISSISLCYMYKVRSEWFSDDLRVPGYDYFIPPFSHYGSAEVRVYGSKSDSIMLNMTSVLKKKISRITKMRKTYYKCLDCIIFESIVAKYCKLPKDWYYYTRRDGDINIEKHRSLDECHHDYCKGNVYLRSCRPCLCNFYQFVGPGMSRWISSVTYGKDYLSPSKKTKNGYVKDVFVNVKASKVLFDKYLKGH